MPIITLARTKELLQIATGDTSKDSLITSLIPSIQALVIGYCKNMFINDASIFVSSKISFNKTDKKINSSESVNSFIDKGFFDGCDVSVMGSLYNDKIYVVKTVGADSLLLDTTETLVIDEAEGNTIIVSRVDFPIDLQLGVAQLIQFHLTNIGKQVVSESLPGGYSVTYRQAESLMKEYFSTYRKPYFI